MRTRYVLAAMLLLAGCYDSLVSDPCAPGYTLQGGTCVAITGSGSGSDGSGSGSGSGSGEVNPGVTLGGTGPVHPGGGEVVCAAPLSQCGLACVDLTSDPLNCGRCGHVCATGLCSASMCVGAVPGHVVAIGHDYTHSEPAMNRVIANAILLGVPGNVRVGWWRGTATAAAASGEVNAAHAGLHGLGRTWTDTTLTGDLTDQELAGIDTLVIEAQTGDGNAAQATGANWTSVLDNFLANGHVVVVLEGASGVSYRLASGAGLYDVSAPTDVSGQTVAVASASDAVATGVPSPYLGKTSTVSFAGAPAAVIVDDAGNPVVFHITR